MPTAPATSARISSSAAISADKRAQRQAEGAQGAEHRAALLEGKADGAVHDEQTHREAEQAEGGEVEVEAVGQPRQVGALRRRAQGQVGGDPGEIGGGQGAGPAGSAGARPGPAGPAGPARRRYRSAAGWGRWQRRRSPLRSNAPFSRAATAGAARIRPGGDRKPAMSPPLVRPSAGDVRRCGQRIEPDQANAFARHGQPPFDDRADLPARPAQGHVGRLVQRLAAGRDQLAEPGFAQCARRPGHSWRGPRH